MGGAIGSYLAGKVQPACLIVESSFTSYVDLGKKCYPYLPVKIFASFEYDTIGYIKQVTCPVLVIHSKADEIIPYEFGPMLYDAVAGEKDFVEIFGRHNDGFLFTGEKYRRAWSDWIEFIEDRGDKGQYRLKLIS